MADNTDVQMNTVVVQLDSQDKASRELTDLKDRLTFYRKKRPGSRRVLPSARSKDAADESDE